MLFIQDAYAQAAPAAQPGGGMGSIIMLVVLFGAMWFFMIRPQQKKMKEHQLLIGSLKKGDEVVKTMTVSPDNLTATLTDL